MVRHLLVAFFICIYPFLLKAQVAKIIVSPEYQDVKYAIIMADHVQAAYDGTDMKKIGGSILDLGDKAFYNGKYINAASRWRDGIGFLPMKPYDGTFGLKQSLSVYAAAKSVNESALDLEHARVYAGALNMIGIYYHSLSRYDQAMEFYEMSMKIRATRIGKTSPAFMNSLQNIAVLKRDLGDYAEAENIFNYLDKVLIKLFSENSSHFAIFLNNKAMLYASLGRNEEALELIEQSLIKAKDYLFDTYFDYERILINKGFLQLKQGDYKNAEISLISAKNRIEQKGFESHPDHNDLLIYIGRLYIEISSAKAIPFIEESINGADRRYGQSHPLYAKAKENEALYYLKAGNYLKAKEAYNIVAGIQLDKLGDLNMDYVQSRMMLGVCEWNLNNDAEAKSNFGLAIKSYLNIIDNVFPAFSETEKSDFWSTMKPDLDVYLSFAADKRDSDPSLLKESLNIYLRTKGMLINSSTSIKDFILKSEDEEVIEIYNNWQEAKDLLSYYYSVPKEQAQEDKINLEELEANANTLEKSLSRRSSKFAGGIESYKDYVQEISAELTTGEGILEIARINPRMGKSKDKVMYLGYLIQSNNSNLKLMIIENGEDLEKKYVNFYKNKIQFKLEDDKSYANFWQVFEAGLTGVNHLYLSLDGIYNTISINSLVNESGAYLVDKREWTFIANSKYITEHKKGLENQGDDKGLAILLGDPSFGDESVLKSLPGTRSEVDSISLILSTNGYEVQKLMDVNASEENVRKVVTPNILHLATHGYFLNDVKSSEGLVLGIRVDKAKSNPLLRSGLMLSESAKNFNNDIVFESPTNGILNAYEAMNLNLSNTNLVVLSACETGKGEIVNGEGVYGLPRSLQVAGAKNVIMSLWKVDDAVTQELMDAFYRNWVGGESLNQSLLLAQRKIKEKYAHPYYWGAFVLLEN